MTDIYRPRLGLRVRVMRALAREGAARKYASLNPEENLQWHKSLEDNPEDMSLHLAYADFLEEHGNPEAANHVRWLVEREGTPRQAVNGVSYHGQTPPELIQALENARQNRHRLLLRYGNRYTGRDWLESHDVRGRIGRSTGTEPIPLLINNSRSMGGGGLLDRSIVKLFHVPSGRVLYQHPLYSLPKIELRAFDDTDPNSGLTHEILTDGEPEARFRSYNAAKRWLKMNGLHEGVIDSTWKPRPERHARKYAAMNHDEHMEWQRRLAEHPDDMAQHLAYADFLEEHDLPHVAAHVRKAVEYREKGLPGELDLKGLNNSSVARPYQWHLGYARGDNDNEFAYTIRHLSRNRPGLNGPIIEIGVHPIAPKAIGPDDIPSSYFVPMRPDEAHRFSDSLSGSPLAEFKKALKDFGYPSPKPQ